MNELISSKKLPVPEYKLYEIGVTIASTEVLTIPKNVYKSYIEYRLRAEGIPVVITSGIDIEDIKVVYGTLHAICDTNVDCIYYTWRLKWIE